ncbi:MAG: 3-phosphoshikimate 1-carboxyvinyltransferase 2 [Betaproteobacteria bacterium]|nr:3-phosphoshikimate 1-carboxyvinyltransferase [Rhodocyclaceae bacterium]
MSKQGWIDLDACAAATGTVRVPGSKSVSNRALLMAALADGDTDLIGLLEADDVQAMRAALQTLGIVIEPLGGDLWRVHGGGGALPVRSADLFLGNAGTAFRPLTAALALAGGEYRLHGVARMHERPIGDLVDALRMLGCRIDYLGHEGYPPLAIHAARITGDRVRVRGNVSSQFLTGLLLAAPQLPGGLDIEVEGPLISQPYIELTRSAMSAFGVVVEHAEPAHFRVAPGSRYRSPGRFEVEADASSASYFLAAGVLGGGPVRVLGVGSRSIQGDIAFADALASVGAMVERGPDWIEVSNPARTVRAFDLDCTAIPDAAMTLAIVALRADGPSRLTGIGSWRVKETDRIAAMATELRKLGAEVEAGAAHLLITPPSALRSAEIDTYDDHRMAMCFALVCLMGAAVRIRDPGCVAKTFPEFFSCLETILKR